MAQAPYNKPGIFIKTSEYIYDVSVADSVYYFNNKSIILHVGDIDVAEYQRENIIKEVELNDWWYKELVDELYAEYAVLNDSRVRLRKSPNLESETITLLNKDTKLYIFEHSDKKQKIDNMEAYWYRVQIPSGKIGWVYGGFLKFE